MECELLDAQNALIRQSVEDARALENPHGWGIGLVHADGKVHCERQAEPASSSAAFRRSALAARGITGMAHVRRATVGQPKLANTHPFCDGRSLLAHNGHVGAFEAVRPRMLAAMRQQDRQAIRGDTDSEHLFHLLRARQAAEPSKPLSAHLVSTARDVARWVREASPSEELALNLLWADGPSLAGSRHHRTLWYTVRSAPYVCPVCGHDHASPLAHERYRCVVIASEKITAETWTEVPEGSVFTLDDEIRIQLAPLGI